MAGGGGGFQATGKITLNKKYFVTDEASLNTAPVISGYLATLISFTRINDTAFEQNVTYEAQQKAGNSNSGGVVWLENGVRGTFEMFCSYESRPIEKHPRLLQLFEKFGGSLNADGTAIFNLLVTAGETALSGGKATKSPMFGVRNYKEITMILRHTYMVENISGSIWNTMGKITTTLPAGIPIPPGEKDEDEKEIKRTWLMQAPALSKQGNAWQVVQEYVLLDASGIGEGMYEIGTTPGDV
jgi:hypothetical protein